MERTSEALVYCPESAEQRRSHLWRSCTEAVIGLLLPGVMAVGNIRGPEHKFISSASDLFWTGILLLWVLGALALLVKALPFQQVIVRAPIQAYLSWRTVVLHRRTFNVADAVVVSVIARPRRRPQFALSIREKGRCRRMLVSQETFGDRLLALNAAKRMANEIGEFLGCALN